jgi:F0F1-type ATP synthase assembly protein I
VSEPPKSPTPEDDPRKSPFRYASIGFEVVVPVVLFMFVGFKVDEWLESSPWMLVGGGFLGIAVGMYNLFKRLIHLGREGNGDRT